MIRKFLLKIRQLIDVLLSESPDETSHQQKVIAVGDNNTIIIAGDNVNPNMIIPKNKTNVKHFSQEKCEKRS